MNIFFISPPEGSVATLSEEESMHCIRVLRMKSGDTIRLADGQGRFYTGTITRPHDRHCEVEITDATAAAPRRTWPIHLAIAPTKSMDRFEWLVEKVTELGCDRITPLLCEHSERKIIKTDRINKVLVAALKQSMQPWLPVLDEMVPFRSFVKDSKGDQRFICSADAGTQLLQHLVSPAHPVILAVGPEGDFSGAELDAAVAAGFRPCSLGPTRLRTETAGLVACHTIHVLNA